MPLVTNRHSTESSLVALQPVDSAPFHRPASAWLVWGSIILVWMASLLPWRLWQPVPDVLLLMLAFWCMNEPGRVGLVTAFVFGFLMDVHDAGLLGLHALCYVLTCYGVLHLRRRMQHFAGFVQMLHVLPVFVLAGLVSRLLGAWLNGEWVGWNWLWSALITGALWPVVDVLMFMRQRRFDDDDVGAV